MARFDVPQGAIRDIADVKVGMTVYEVFGCWPPFRSGPQLVVGEPMKNSQHHEYSDIHESQKDLIVFDLAEADGRYASKTFASDRNLEAGHSHNDNYLFLSKEDADTAVKWLREQWEAQPDGIAQAERFSRELWLDSDYDVSYQYDDEPAAA